MPPEARKVMRARRALFQKGLELPGRRLEVFAAALLALAEAHPDRTPPDLVASVVAGMEADPIALSPRSRNCASSSS